MDISTGHTSDRFCSINLSCIRVGAQSTLGGEDIFDRKICMKN